MTPLAARDPRVDALRGFALLGIVLVNVQSFLWGATNPVGYLAESASRADRAVYFLTAAFVSMKFMPLFAMLFGAGFVLLYRRLETLTATPRPIYRRRMVFLFAFGILHGVFFYLGDITHMYAVAVSSTRLCRSRAAGSRRRHWWIGTARQCSGYPVRRADRMGRRRAQFEIFMRRTSQLPRVANSPHAAPISAADDRRADVTEYRRAPAQADALAWRTAPHRLLVGLPHRRLRGGCSTRVSLVRASPLAATTPMFRAWRPHSYRRCSSAREGWSARLARRPYAAHNFSLRSVAIGALCPAQARARPLSTGCCGGLRWHLHRQMG
jgi:hypothetical protein